MSTELTTEVVAPTLEKEGFRQVSPKVYEAIIDDKPRLIKMPFGKVQKVFAALVQGNFQIDTEGNVTVANGLDFMVNIVTVVNTVLNEYDDKGNLALAGSCTELSDEDVMKLFTLGVYAFKNFTKRLENLQTLTV